MSAIPREEPWLRPEAASYDALNTVITAPLIGAVKLGTRPWRRWWIAFLCALPFGLLFLTGFAVSTTQGIGVWGNNTTLVWGFDIANYVWWIGIGNAGTLISALLLLTRQAWRSSINRFAEAMTLFAAAIAGLFPIFHLGRPVFAYWLAPYPNPMALWPQWRSALVWDFWAIGSYLLFSLTFWYTGLIPDLATLRDRAKRPRTRRLYAVFALGWRGSARQWALHGSFYKTMAGLAVPLVCSVHSIVGLDFAASLMPGWEESLFPPYFVVGAMFSGFAMVVLIAALIRWGLGLDALITPRHFDAMAKILLAGSCVMALSYATEGFTAWFSGDRAERSYLAYAWTGRYGGVYGLMLLFNCLLPQALWSARVRRSLPALAMISACVLVGMWFERILIIWNTLGHGHLPSLWAAFHPRFWDWAILFGSVGAFACMFLVFVRVIPAVSLHEMRELADAERPA